ncbi:GNAT family N-acetyltransferase [Photobacterium sanguinicancri]|uniref:GNAT family N-acetyltransferase n=1 Tax=Photobacterium sanguinicancri TaxID=875932 RepID=UPI003D13387C
MIRVITSELAWKSELEDAYYDWYHTWDYHYLESEKSKSTPYLFIYEHGGAKIALPLLLNEINEKYSDFNSVYGYPGFIVYGDGTEDLIPGFIEELKLWCFKNNIVSVFTRLNSLVLNYKEIEPIGETVVINLERTKDLQRARYRKNNRNLINKLKNSGYSCSWDNSSQSLYDFMDIYNQTMTSLGAAESYYFSEVYFKSLLKSSDFHTRIYNCYFNGVTVCSGIFIFCNDIVQYHLSGTLSEYKHAAPNRLMLDTVRNDATDECYKLFHLGGGIGGRRDGLFDFKYSFSKEAIDFQVLKIITNKEQYSNLSNISLDELKLCEDDFFPLYRKTDKMLK